MYPSITNNDKAFSAQSIEAFTREGRNECVENFGGPTISPRPSVSLQPSSSPTVTPSPTVTASNAPTPLCQCEDARFFFECRTQCGSTPERGVCQYNLRTLKCEYNPYGPDDPEDPEDPPEDPPTSVPTGAPTGVPTGSPATEPPTSTPTAGPTTGNNNEPNPTMMPTSQPTVAEDDSPCVCSDQGNVFDCFSCGDFGTCSWQFGTSTCA